jgi:hypothetical protein
MRFISSLCWIQKGKSSTPTRLKIEKNEMKQIFAEKKRSNYDDDDEENNQIPDLEEDDSKSIDENEKINKKYNLDDYDQEDNDIRLDHLNSLACFSTNNEDAMLTMKDDVFRINMKYE